MGLKANVLVGDAQITLGVGVNAIVIGYTVDGVTMVVRSTDANIKVEENEGTLIRRLTDQEVDVTLNVAEGTLAILAAAIPGAVATSAEITTIGGGTLQSTRLTLVGIDPAGKPRVIVLTEVNPTGEVGVPFKKGEVSVIPVTFSALVADSGIFGTVTDAAAVAPTLEVGVHTKVIAGGETMELLFSKAMADPAGKFLEFWFTESTVGVRAFKTPATVVDSTITLTVDGAAIGAGHTIAVYYALGTVAATDTGVLASFSAQAVVGI